MSPVFHKPFLRILQELSHILFTIVCYDLLRQTQERKVRFMTFLDLLVLASGGIIAAGLLIVAAIFLLKNEKV